MTGARIQEIVGGRPFVWLKPGGQATTGINAGVIKGKPEYRRQLAGDLKPEYRR
ncbi:MAG: hypothetical protein V4717_16700 [Bacteroidota bacterium]